MRDHSLKVCHANDASSAQHMNHQTRETRTQKASQTFPCSSTRSRKCLRFSSHHNSQLESRTIRQRCRAVFTLEEGTRRHARTTPVSATRRSVHAPVYIHVHIRHTYLPEKSRDLAMSFRNISVNAQRMRTLQERRQSVEMLARGLR